jgi:hypothetical protein
MDINIKKVSILKVLDNNRGEGKVFYCEFEDNDEYKRTIFIPINFKILQTENRFYLKKRDLIVEIPAQEEHLENILNTPPLFKKIIKKEKVVLFDLKDSFFEMFNNKYIKTMKYVDEKENKNLLFIYFPSNFDFVYDDFSKSRIYREYLKNFKNYGIPSKINYLIYQNKAIPLFKFVCDGFGWRVLNISGKCILYDAKKKSEVFKDVYVVMLDGKIIHRRHLVIGSTAHIYDETFLDDILLNRTDLDYIYDVSKTFKIFFEKKLRSGATVEDILKALKEAIVSFLYKNKNKNPYYTFNRNEFVEFIKNLAENIKYEKELIKEVNEKIELALDTLHAKQYLKNKGYVVLNEYFFNEKYIKIDVSDEEFKDLLRLGINGGIYTKDTSPYVGNKKELVWWLYEKFKDEIDRRYKEFVKKLKKEGKKSGDTYMYFFFETRGVRFCYRISVSKFEHENKEYINPRFLFTIVYPYVSLYSCLNICSKIGIESVLFNTACSVVERDLGIGISIDWMDDEATIIEITKGGKKYELNICEDNFFAYENVPPSEEDEISKKYKIFFKIIDDIDKTEKGFSKKIIVFEPWKVVTLDEAKRMLNLKPTNTIDFLNSF